MKKMFIVLFMVVSLVMAGSVMAVEPAGQVKDGPGIYKHVTGKTKYFSSHPGEPSQWVFQSSCVECEPDNHATVTGTYSALAMDKDESFSSTGNDYGWSYGQYGVGGDMDTFADGYRGFQKGFIYSKNKVKAFSWAKDYGLTSKAGAGIKADEGFVSIVGFVYGRDKFITSRITYGADFYQWNDAKEVGYSAGDVVAGNSSGLNFRGSTDWKTYTFFGGGHLNGTSFTPDIMTFGKSEVTIDPYGSYRSIVAHTENFSRINLDAGRCNPNIYINQANVYGNGFVAGQISNGGAFAGGKATFSYNGYTNGQGQADLNAYVNTQGQSTVAFVSGSSSAVANGANGVTPK